MWKLVHAAGWSVALLVISGGFNCFGQAMPPTISKAFLPGSIVDGGTSTLTFTIINPNVGTALTGIGFTDTLPANVTVATPNGLTGSCGGGTITATAGSGSISLSGATLAASGSCTFSVNVTGTDPVPVPSMANNSVTITSTEGGTGNTATATLIIEPAEKPTFTKAFSPTSIPDGGTTTLTFAIHNPNTFATLTGIGFTDALPPQLIVALPIGLTGSCGGGTITAPPISGFIVLSGATLAAGASCTFSVNVIGWSSLPIPVLMFNMTTAISTVQTAIGPPAFANLTVGPAMAPRLSKAFGVPAMLVGGTTSLSFTIHNPNPFVSLAGINFMDTLPAGLTVAAPNGLTGDCAGVTAVAGSGTISLTAGFLSRGASCTFSVNVKADTTTGTRTNSVVGIGGLAVLPPPIPPLPFVPVDGPGAMASILVFTGPDTTITKTHTGDFVQGENGVASYTITVGNAGNAPTSGTVTVTDTLPASLTAVSIGGTGWSCTLATLTCTRSDALPLGSSYPPIIVVVNVSETAPALVTNTATVSGGADANPNNDTATDPTIVLACGDHTVHGHITTTPPDGHDGDSHAHHAQHGHHLLIGVVCLPPGHHVTVAGHILGLTREAGDGAVPIVLTPEPDFVAALNQEGLGAPGAPAARGSVVQLFGSARGFFLDLADQRPALLFTPPVSSSLLYYTERLPEVQIGGVQAKVLFSGLAPGLQGVWQINVRVPDDAPLGRVPVTVAYDGDALRSVDVEVR